MRIAKRRAWLWLSLAGTSGLLQCAEPLEQPEVASELSELDTALTETKVFAPIADAPVEQLHPTTNYAASNLKADLAPHQETFLKFSLAGISDRVQSARLRLYATDPSADGPAVYRAQNGWTETGLVWNTRPALSGGALDDKAAITTNTWIEWDVTAAVQRDGELSFAIIPTSSDGATFHSRESSSTALRPQLVVTLRPLGFPVPTDCMARSDVYVNFPTLWSDFHVEQANPSATYDSAATLNVDAAPREEAFLLFDGDHPFHTLQRATLSLYALDATADGPAVYRSTPFEGSPARSWNTRPSAAGAVLSDAGALRANSWVDYDVTAAVREDITRFALMPTSSDGVDFVSNGQSPDSPFAAFRPRLRIERQTAPFCTYRGTGGGGTRGLIHDGGPGTESLLRLAAAPNGDLVALGVALPGASIGGMTFTQRRLFVVRYRPDGSTVWVRSFTATFQFNQFHDLAVTPLGNVLITGAYNGNPDFGTGPIQQTGNGALFVLKLNPNGSTAWVRGFQAVQDGSDGVEPVPALPLAIATDAQGSAILTGFFYGRMNLGGGMIESGARDNDEDGSMFLAKLDWAGNHAWSKGFPDTLFHRGSHGNDVATDASGNIYLAGYISQLTDLGDGETGGREEMPFLARYDASGQLVWKKVYRQALGQMTRLAVDGQGLRLAFAGQFGGSFVFAGTPYVVGDGDPNVQEPFTGVVQTQGSDVWIRPGLSASALAYAGTDLVVSGLALTPVNLGGGELGTDIGYSWVVRMQADGTHRWSRALDSDFQVGGLVTADGVVLGGTFDGPFEHDGARRTPRGGSDVLLLRLAP